MIQYVALGQIGSGKVTYDYLVDERMQKNYSAYMNHSLSVLKLDSENVEENKKQTSSFGSWYTLPCWSLCLIVLSDTGFGDSQSMAFLQSLSDDLQKNFTSLCSEPSTASVN